MSLLRIACLALFLALLANPLAAKVETYHFDNEEQEALYHELVEEVRCLVCQNQNIAASNAELAQDLRKLTYEMVKSGKSREEILLFMVDRYGDFVLYEPPVKRSTLVLWVGPFVLLIIAFVVMVRIIGKRQTNSATLSQEDRERAERLLSGDQEKS